MSKETYMYVKRGFVYDVLENVTQWSDASSSANCVFGRDVKRDLYICQKRPICMLKDTYVYVKRGLMCVRKRL